MSVRPNMATFLMRQIFSIKAFMVSVLAIAPMAGAQAETQTAVQDAWLVPVNGTSIIQDTGVANRLVVGEVLRSLTQEIPAAACFLHAGVNVEDATDNLMFGINQLDELLEALSIGDIFWGIEHPEERRKTISEIEALRADWAPVQRAGRALLDDPANAEAAAGVAGAADPLMDRTYRLLTTLDSQYSSSAEILKRDVMFIQISGRMAALNQRLALHACLMSKEFDQALATELSATSDMYHNSLHALMEGLPAMGILPPQTPGIAEKLSEIEGIWNVNQPMLALVASCEGLSPAQLHDLYYNLIDERVLILDLVYLYQDHSKVH